MAPVVSEPGVVATTCMASFRSGSTSCKKLTCLPARCDVIYPNSSTGSEYDSFSTGEVPMSVSHLVEVDGRAMVVNGETSQ